MSFRDRGRRRRSAGSNDPRKITYGRVPLVLVAEIESAEQIIPPNVWIVGTSLHCAPVIRDCEVILFIVVVSVTPNVKVIG